MNTNCGEVSRLLKLDAYLDGPADFAIGGACVIISAGHYGVKELVRVWSRRTFAIFA